MNETSYKIPVIGMIAILICGAAMVAADPSTDATTQPAADKSQYNLFHPDLIGKLDVYVEYAGDFTTEKHSQAVQTLDVGYVYPLTDNMVLDTGLAIGLNKASDNLEVLAGLSVRF